MPRRKTDKHFIVALPSGSDLLHFYEEEAKRRGVKVPKHIEQLLRERYESLVGTTSLSWDIPLSGSSPSRERREEKVSSLTEGARDALSIFGGEDEEEEEEESSDEEKPTQPRMKAARRKEEEEEG